MTSAWLLLNRLLTGMIDLAFRLPFYSAGLMAAGILSMFPEVMGFTESNWGLLSQSIWRDAGKT